MTKKQLCRPHSAFAPGPGHHPSPPTLEFPCYPHLQGSKGDSNPSTSSLHLRPRAQYPGATAGGCRCGTPPAPPPRTAAAAPKGRRFRRPTWWRRARWRWRPPSGGLRRCRAGSQSVETSGWLEVKSVNLLKPRNWGWKRSGEPWMSDPLDFEGCFSAFAVRLMLVLRRLHPVLSPSRRLAPSSYAFHRAILAPEPGRTPKWQTTA